MPSQRPFFLSTFFAAFRQQPNLPSSSPSSQPNKQPASVPASSYPSTSTTTARTITTTTNPSSSGRSATSSAAGRSSSQHGHGVIGQLPLHSPRSGAVPIPQNGNQSNRRRGSDSSSEGFRDVMGAEKLYIGGRTATGEEKFFKLGVVRRVRSGDRLSLDRLSL